MGATNELATGELAGIGQTHYSHKFESYAQGVLYRFVRTQRLHLVFFFFQLVFLAPWRRASLCDLPLFMASWSSFIMCYVLGQQAVARPLLRDAPPRQSRSSVASRPQCLAQRLGLRVRYLALHQCLLQMFFCVLCLA
jgi:hypothetical protein